MEFLETFYTKFVPFFLFTVMVAMGLSLTVNDLMEVVRKPKAILVGLGAQLFILPVIAIGYGLLLNSPPVIAAGAIILAACPGGITSNAYVFASRADIALSIGLTAIASMITVFSIPFRSGHDLPISTDSDPTNPTKVSLGPIFRREQVPQKGVVK